MSEAVEIIEHPQAEEIYMLTGYQNMAKGIIPTP